MNTPSFKIVHFLFIFSILFFSCDKDDDPEDVTKTMEVSLKYGTEGLELNKYYPTDSYELKFEDVKIYISEVDVVCEGNEKVRVSDLHFVDLRKPESLKFDMTYPYRDIKQINLTIGLTPSQNATNPADVDQNHPLSEFNGMFWSWQSKYRFLTFSGKFRTINSSFEEPFNYHPGNDKLYVQSSFDVSKLNDNVSFILEVDLEKVFNGPNKPVLPEEKSDHGRDETYQIGKKIIDSFRENIVFK